MVSIAMGVKTNSAVFTDLGCDKWVERSSGFKRFGLWCPNFSVILIRSVRESIAVALLTVHTQR